MKKVNNKKIADDLRTEYDLSKLKGGARGKYHGLPARENTAKMAVPRTKAKLRHAN